MAENWDKNHYVGGDKDARELKHIVGLFKEMREMETFTAKGDQEDVIRKEIYKMIELHGNVGLENNTRKELFRLIARKRYWD